MFSGYEIMLSKYSNVEKYPLNSDKRIQLRNKIIVWLYTKEDTLEDMKSLLSDSEVAFDIKRKKVVYFLRRNDYKGDLSKLNTEKLMLSAISTCLESLQEKKNDFSLRENNDEELTAVMHLINNTRDNDVNPADIQTNINTLIKEYGFSINQLSKLGFKDIVGEVLKGQFSVQVTLKEKDMDSDNEKDKLKIKRAVFRELLVTYQKNRLTPKILRELLGYEGDNLQKNPDLDWEKSFVADQFRFFSRKDKGTFSPKSMKNPLIRALSMLSKEEEYSKVDALMLYKLRAKLLNLLTKGPETPANQFLRAVYSPLRDNREEQEAKKVELIPDIEIANYLLNQSDILSRIAQSLNIISPEDNRTPDLDADYVKEYLKIVTAKGERDLLKKGFLQNGFPTLYHTTKSKKTFEQIAQNGYIEMSGTETHPSRSTQTETYAGAYGSTWPELEGGKYGFAFAAPEDNWPKFRSKADGFATWLGFSNRINLKSVCFVYADVSLWRWRKGNKLKTCTVAGKVVPKFKPSQVILLAVAVRQAKAEILDDKADAYQVDPMHWFQQHELANISAHIFNHHNYELFLKMESKDIIELLKVISDDDMNEILGGFSQYQMIKHPELKLSTLRNSESLTTLLSGELSTRAKSDIEKQYVLFNRVEQLMKLRAIDFSKSKTTLANMKLKGYSVDVMKAIGFTVEELREGGFGAKKLKDSDFSVEELRKGGFNALELKKLGFTFQELKEVGFSARDLKASGFSAKTLKSVGCFSTEELKAGGFSPRELKVAGFRVGELKEGGFSAKELKSYFGVKDLKAGGFSVTELKEADLDIGILIDYFSVEELKKGGFSTEKLTAIGLSKSHSTENGIFSSYGKGRQSKGVATSDAKRKNGPGT